MIIALSIALCALMAYDNTALLHSCRYDPVMSLCRQMLVAPVAQLTNRYTKSV